jgi:protein-ribulosamine 3-kinase
MMEGEFNSMNEIYKLLPSFVPKPHAWGRFELASPVTHFFLCDFLDISNDMPDPVRFAACVAELHRISRSPTGKFGFHVPNCHGKIRQTVDWNSSWASFYTKLLTSFFHTEIDVNGPWPEYERVFEEVVTHVIPQLLEPLQSDGRVLKPCLVHGDLWEENTATDLETGEINVVSPQYSAAFRNIPSKLPRNLTVRKLPILLRSTYKINQNL